MAGTMKRPGRKPHIANRGTRAALGLKVTHEIKNKLDGAAKANGRTQSQEAEARIEQTFQMQDLLDQVLTLAYGAQLAGLMMAIGRAMKTAGSTTALNVTNSYDAMDHWPEYRAAFDEAFEAAKSVLQHYRQRAGAAPYDEPLGGDREYRESFGKRLAEQIVNEIDRPSNAGFDPPFARKINALLGSRLIKGNQE
jgi:hypothetical protein